MKMNPQDVRELIDVLENRQDDLRALIEDSEEYDKLDPLTRNMILRQEGALVSLLISSENLFHQLNYLALKKEP